MSKLTLVEQASAPDTPGSGRVSIFVDTNGDLAWRDDAGNVIKIAAAGSYTLTIPATGTAALLGTAQTFSALQTFSNALVAPGMKPAADSTTALQLQKSNGTAVLTVDTTNSKVNVAALKINGVDVPYDQGAWTPTLEGTSSNPTVTYTEQLGYYTVIGNIVIASVRLVTSAISGGSGNIRFAGLPYTCADVQTVGAVEGKFTFPASRTAPVLFPIASTTKFYLAVVGSGISTSLVPVSSWPADGSVTGTLIYRI